MEEVERDVALAEDAADDCCRGAVEDVVERIVRRDEVVAGLASEEISGAGAEHIIRFWKSACLDLSRSRGEALRAIPRA